MTETTSPSIATIASRGLSDPKSLSEEEIRSVCASALTQAEGVPAGVKEHPAAIGADAPDSAREADHPLYCSFCAKSNQEVRKIIAGPAAFICDECVDLCADIVRQERSVGITDPIDRIKELTDQNESLRWHVRQIGELCEALLQPVTDQSGFEETDRRTTEEERPRTHSTASWTIGDKATITVTLHSQDQDHPTHWFVTPPTDPENNLHRFAEQDLQR